MIGFGKSTLIQIHLDRQNLVCLGKVLLFSSVQRLVASPVKNAINCLN
jgi:hypothetical protein